MPIPQIKGPNPVDIQVRRPIRQRRAIVGLYARRTGGTS